MRTMIAVPCMDMVHTDFMRSALSLQHRDETQFYFSQASLVYDGRNKLAAAAISGKFDRVLWLDSDMRFEPELAEQLHADLDEGREFVSALYFSRKPPITPVIYKDITSDVIDGQQWPRADSFIDYPADSIFPIAGCGFGAVMMTAELLQRVREAYGLPFAPFIGFGEDLSFCMRVRELGTEMWCDSRVKPGHVGLSVFDEELYRQKPVRHVNL